MSDTPKNDPPLTDREYLTALAIIIAYREALRAQCHPQNDDERALCEARVQEQVRKYAERFFSFVDLDDPMFRKAAEIH
jgi:hypothetical protein